MKRERPWKWHAGRKIEEVGLQANFKKEREEKSTVFQGCLLQEGFICAFKPLTVINVIKGFQQ